MSLRESSGTEIDTIHHPSHQHPLRLRELFVDNGPPDLLHCGGCEFPVRCPTYCCEQCKFVLHGLCAEFPYKITHPFHSQHRLDIFIRVHKPAWSDGREVPRQTFAYRCSQDCGFELECVDAIATLPEERESSHETIQYIFHEHPLTACRVKRKCSSSARNAPNYPYQCGTLFTLSHLISYLIRQELLDTVCCLESLAYFEGGGSLEIRHSLHEHPLRFGFEHCVICGDTTDRPSYFCNTKNCKFWVHKSCSELPNVMEHPFHPQHRLTLNPKEAREFTCSACNIKSSTLAFSCGGDCNFHQDSSCAFANPGSQTPAPRARAGLLQGSEAVEVLCLWRSL